jgi:hypothetical protein
MPGGSKICGHFTRISRSRWQRAYHNVNSGGVDPCWWVRHMSGGEMPQPALDAIASNGVAKRSTDDKADARTRAAASVRCGRDIFRGVYGMNDQRRPTHSKPPPGRSPEVFRVVHS